MLARMSGKAERTRQTKSAPHFVEVVRGEFALLIGLGTAAIFFAAGGQLVEIVAHPVAVIVVFLWLFAVILCSAICVESRANFLAINVVESYVPLILKHSCFRLVGV